MERAQTDRPRVDTPRQIGSYHLITCLVPTGRRSPAAVRLAGDGPRPTGFGAVRN